VCLAIGLVNPHILVIGIGLIVDVAVALAVGFTVAVVIAGVDVPQATNTILNNNTNPNRMYSVFLIPNNLFD
jgi:hypothetical protein